MSHDNSRSLTHNKCNRINKRNILNNYDYVILNQLANISLVYTKNISIRANIFAVGANTQAVGINTQAVGTNISAVGTNIFAVGRDSNCKILLN